MKKQPSRKTPAPLEHARQFLEQGQMAEARQALAQCLQNPQEQPGWHAGIGQLAAQLDDYTLATEHLNIALSHSAADTTSLVWLARVYTNTAQLDKAATLLDMALAQAGETFETCSALAVLHGQLFDHTTAVQWAKKALKFKPDDLAMHLGLAYSLAETDELAEAITHADKARLAAPHHVECHLILGRLQAFAGETEKARRHVEKALQLDPLSARGIEQLAGLKKWTEQDLPFVQSVEGRPLTDMHIRERAHVHFALGKMYDDMGHYDLAFAHYTKANTFGKPSAEKSFDEGLMKKQRALCTRSYLASRSRAEGSDTPVFIVGTPRSGTSLVEQIIASHPQAAGAGELRHIGRLTHTLLGEGLYHDGALSSRLPEPALLDSLAEEYLGHLRKRRESALRITDKMPENYHVLGVITALFPRARIIHIQRHPLDSCLSCYFQHFGENTWSYDLDWIADNYKRYRQTMEHWHKTLPAGMLMDVQYEDIVANPETEARRLLEHIHLPWDPACLDFFANAREVRTVSVMQVRQPIYQTSRQRWVHYAAHLGELAKHLNAYLSDEDRAILAAKGVSLRKPFWGH